MSFSSESSYLATPTNSGFQVTSTFRHQPHSPTVVQQGAKKDAYMSNLKRVAKNLVFIEPTREGNHSCENYSDGLYALSWDDWEAYGPKRTGLTTLDDTDVFTLRQ